MGPVKVRTDALVEKEGVSRLQPGEFIPLPLGQGVVALTDWDNAHRLSTEAGARALVNRIRTLEHANEAVHAAIPRSSE